METKYNTINAPSPVSRGGSFESDRIIKSWKPAFLVLRPNVLSVYKDQDEKELRHKIILSEISAVALRKDRKGKDAHPGVFGIFCPARNFHLEADTEGEAADWVQVIKVESRLDVVELSLDHSGSPLHRPTIRNRFQALDDIVEPPIENSLPGTATHNAILGLPLGGSPKIAASIRRPSDYELSGNEAGSYSDFSDGPTFGSARDLPYGSPPRAHARSITSSAIQNMSASSHGNPQATPGRAPFYKLQIPANEGERVIWHGYLQCRKSQGHVRQWKNYWVVLRYKNLTMYKGEEEYAALLIIPLSTVIDIVETDPVGKNKKHCMQIITDDRSYRFCASDEDDLSNWIGRIKSVLARRRDADPK